MAAHQVVGHHVGNAGILTDLHFDQISSGVHGIVVDLDQELLTVDAVQREGVLRHFALFDVLLRAGGSQAAGTGLVIQAGSSDVLVVGSSDGHGVVHHIHADTLQFRSGIVDDQIHGAGSTLAQGIPIHIAFVVNVVLGNQGEGHGDLIALVGVLHGEVGFQNHHGVLPAVNLIGVVGHVDSAGLLIQEYFAGGLVDHNNTGLVSMADGGKPNAVDIVAGVDGIALRHINGVGNHGVAAQGVVIVGVVGISDLEFVAAQNAGIGNAGVLTGVVSGPHTHVKHRRIGPVAEEAQNGDGVAGAGLAVCVLRFGIQVALQVSTVGINLIQFSLHALGQAEINTNIHRTVCGQHSGGGGKSAQENISIVRVDVAVAVHISLVLVVQLHQQAGGVIQQALAIVHINEAVAVEVHTGHIRSLGGNPGAADGPDHIHSDHGSGVVHIKILAIGQQVLNKEVSAQVDILLLIGQIADGEGCAVSTGPVGIVKQFHLNLTVSGAGIGAFAHDDEGVGSDGIMDVRQAGALLQNGEVVILICLDRLSSGHQQALSQMTHIHAGFGIQIIFLDVLRQQSSHTGNLGRSHRSTGLNGISAAVGIQTLDREDVAAGGSDLRLHFQRAGNTPGGEVGHGIVFAVEGAKADGIADIHLTGVIQHITLSILDSLGFLADNLTLHLGQEDSRLLLEIIGHIHIDNAVLVVVDHHRNGARRHSIVRLIKETNTAAGANGDLALQCVAYCSPVLCRTHAVDEDIFLLTGQGREGFHVVEDFLNVNDYFPINGEVVTHHAVVFNRSDTQGVGEGAGLAGGVHSNVGIVQIAAIVGILHPRTGVTGRDGNHNTGLGQVFHDFLEISVGVMATAGRGGAQGQVDGISAQQNGIFNGCEEVRIAGRALLAEDLHGQQLCIGSHALHEAVVQRLAEIAGSGVIQPGVSSGNAGNMGAMVTLFIVVVGDIIVKISVVIAEGDLAVDIGRLGIDSHIQLAGHLGNFFCIQQIQACNVSVLAHALLFSQLSQRVFKGNRVHALVIGVDTGINHGDPHTGAGVAGFPHRGGADLCTGGCHIGRNLAGLCLVGNILILQHHILNAGQLFNGLDLAILHIGRNQVGCQSQIPDHIQIGFDGTLDLVDHIGLILLQALTIVHRSLIACNIHRAVASIDGGSLIQNDGYTNHIRGRILLLVRDFRLTVGGQTGSDFTVIYASEADVGFSGLMVVINVQGKAGQDIASQQSHDQQHA